MTHGSMIKNATALGGGGAASFRGSDGSMLMSGSSSVVDTSSGVSGGAFSWGHGPYFVTSILGCSFVNTRAPDGGCIVCSGHLMTISDCSFHKSSAQSNGGCFYGGFEHLVLTMTGVSMVDCSISEKSATNGGAGMFIYGSQQAVVLHGCSFRNMTSNGLAGTLFSVTSVVILSSCNIVHSATLGGGGGAFLLHAGALTISNSSLVDCRSVNDQWTASGFGGVVWVSQGEFNMTSTSIIGAWAAVGGVMGSSMVGSQTGARFFIENVSFVDAFATWGSVMYTSLGIVSMTKCSIRGGGNIGGTEGSVFTVHAGSFYLQSTTVDMGTAADSFALIVSGVEDAVEGSVEAVVVTSTEFVQQACGTFLFGVAGLPFGPAPDTVFRDVTFTRLTGCAASAPSDAVEAITDQGEIYSIFTASDSKGCGETYFEWSPDADGGESLQTEERVVGVCFSDQEGACLSHTIEGTHQKSLTCQCPPGTTPNAAIADSTTAPYFPVEVGRQPAVTSEECLIRCN